MPGPEILFFMPNNSSAIKTEIKLEPDIGESEAEIRAKAWEELGITEEEFKQRIDRLQSLGRVIGEDFDMQVRPGLPGKGWRYYFKPVNAIEVDPIDVIEKGEEYCLGIISHEGAHRRVSRKDFIPTRIWRQLGFSELMNIVEDPRVNNWVSAEYAGAAGWLKGLYDSRYTPDKDMQVAASRKLGYLPDHKLFGREVFRHWHLGEISEDLPEQLRLTLDKTIKFIEKAYNAVPGKDPEEQEVVEQARRSYQIVYSAVWPEYQKLLQQDLEEEKKNQLIRKLMEEGKLPPPEEPEPGEPPEAGQPKETAAQPEEAGPEEKISPKEEKPESPAAAKEGKPEAKPEEQPKWPPDLEPGEPIPWESIPEEIRNQLIEQMEKILAAMPAEEREKLEQEALAIARRIFGELQEESNEELGGHFVEYPETEAEEQARLEREKELARLEAQRLAELKRIREKLEAEERAGKTEYDLAYDEVHPYIEKVAEDIINLFVSRRFPEFKKGFPGQKIRLQGAMDWQARQEYRELFERRLAEERKEFEFLLLVDLSGSMRGDKIKETFKGVVLFVEALNRVGEILGNLRLAIYGFQDELIPYLKFLEHWDNSKRKEISVMKYEVEDRGKHNECGSNSDGYCVDKVSEILSAQPGGNKFLIVLSDGLPAPAKSVPRYRELSGSEELKKVIADISKKGDQHVLGIGLGPGTEHVRKFYRSDLPQVDNLVEENISRLAETIGDKLEELIK